MVNEAILILGSNLNNKEKHINDAIRLLSLEFNCKKRSSIYKSKAWGYESDNDFFNLAISIDCEIDPHALLSKVIEIEDKLGRKRSSAVRYSDRTIDIDIILYGDSLVDTPELVIPHPRFHLRDFCLIPMNEIAPEKLVPMFGKSVKELHDEFKKNQNIELIRDKV